MILVIEKYKKKKKKKKQPSESPRLGLIHTTLNQLNKRFPAQLTVEASAEPPRNVKMRDAEKHKEKAGDVT